MFVRKNIRSKKFLVNFFVKLGLTWVNGVRINLSGGGAGRINLICWSKKNVKKFWQGKQKNRIGLTQGPNTEFGTSRTSHCHFGCVPGCGWVWVGVVVNCDYIA